MTSANSWAVLEQRARYAAHCGNPVEVPAAELLDLIELARVASKEITSNGLQTVVGVKRECRKVP